MATTKTLTLDQFLLARIAEDEERVSQAIGTTPWAVNPPNLFHNVALRHLGDCEAKRRIVESARNYRPELEHGDNGDWAFGLALRELALPYADHPDYRDDWRPDDDLPRGQYGPTGDYGDG